jgi:hypothetical protein
MVVILDFIYYVVDQINTDVRPNIFNHCMFDLIFLTIVNSILPVTVLTVSRL